jgi:hypothetical protein
MAFFLFFFCPSSIETVVAPNRLLSVNQSLMPGAGEVV